MKNLQTKFNNTFLDSTIFSKFKFFYFKSTFHYYNRITYLLWQGKQVMRLSPRAWHHPCALGCPRAHLLGIVLVLSVVLVLGRVLVLAVALVLSCSASFSCSRPRCTPSAVLGVILELAVFAVLGFLVLFFALGVIVVFRVVLVLGVILVLGFLLPARLLPGTPLSLLLLGILVLHLCLGAARVQVRLYNFSINIYCFKVILHIQYYSLCQCQKYFSRSIVSSFAFCFTFKDI